MPSRKSAKKSMRQSLDNRVRNKSRKSLTWTMEKKFQEKLEAKDIEGAEKALSAVSSALDKAAKTNAVHINRVNRKKARLFAALQKAKG